MECTCYIREYDDSTEPQLIKCKLCKAAPELYEALKGIYKTRHAIPLDLSELAYKALAKVEK